MKKTCSLLALSFAFLTMSVEAQVNNIASSIDRSTGISLAAFEYYTLTDTQIQANIEDNAGVWGTATVLSNPGICIYNQVPKTAMGSANTMIVVWAGTDPISFNLGLFGNFYSGGVWNGAFMISDPTGYILSTNFNLQMSSDLGSGTYVAKVTWTSLISGDILPRSCVIQIPSGTMVTNTVPFIP